MLITAERDGYFGLRAKPAFIDHRHRAITVFLLSMSTAYHLPGPGTGRDVMRQLDIAGVFALIAGTMTPIHAILDRGFKRWASLLVVWSVCITGITLRTVFSEALPSGVGIGIFLLFGWCGLITCILLWRRYDFCFVKPLFWGGVAYSVGAVVLGQNWLIIILGVVGAHEVVARGRPYRTGPALEVCVPIRSRTS